MPVDPAALVSEQREAASPEEFNRPCTLPLGVCPDWLFPWRLVWHCQDGAAISGVCVVTKCA